MLILKKIYQYMKFLICSEEQSNDSKYKNNQHYNLSDDYYDEPYDRKKLLIEHIELRYRHF